MNNDSEKSFAAAVRVTRQIWGMSQVALAAELRAHGITIDGTAITKLEKGTHSIRLGEAVAIASVLEIDLGSLTDAGLTRRIESARARVALRVADLREAEDSLARLEARLGGETA